MIPSVSTAERFVNCDDYADTGETFAILPLNAERRRLYGMAAHPDTPDRESRHWWLANAQQTRFAVLPVYKSEERELFRNFVKEKNGLLSGACAPDWVQLARRWAAYADGSSIFYKVRLWH
jgi:hypothetical protein